MRQWLVQQPRRGGRSIDKMYRLAPYNATFISLAGFLSGNQTLESLNLRFNSVSEAGVQTLYEALELRNYHLIELQIDSLEGQFEGLTNRNRMLRDSVRFAACHMLQVARLLLVSPVWLEPQLGSLYETTTILSLPMEIRQYIVRLTGDNHRVLSRNQKSSIIKYALGQLPTAYSLETFLKLTACDRVEKTEHDET